MGWHTILVAGAALVAVRARGAGKPSLAVQDYQPPREAACQSHSPPPPPLL